MSDPIAVWGIGIVSAFGTSHQSFRDALLGGRSAIAPVSGFSTAGCRSTLAAEITVFDAAAWIAPMRLRRLDRTGVYAIAAAKLGLQDADITLATDGHDDIGVVLGTWTAGGQSTQQFLDALFRHGPAGAPALLFDSTVGNSAASVAALELKLRGPNVTVSHKEASGLAGIVTAVDHLREGRGRALFAGGVDAVYETFFKGHDRFNVMSPAAVFSNVCAPFDAERSGFVIGEGGFGLWLGRAPIATARHHGDVIGVAASSAAVPVNRWPDDPAALARTMRLALADAGAEPGDVDVVYASANATPALEAVEMKALAGTFADSRAVVTSIKGALGESGAAGAASCAAALLCGREGRVPPIAGWAVADPASCGLRLAVRPMDTPGPIAMINSFASGGALFSVVLRVAT